jgi:predicted thioredoxin/glutaredoxin
VLSSPTTDQIIEGLRVELREAVLPEVPAASGRLAIEMLDNLLSNLAVRSAHEIAWMRDECEQIEQLATSVDDAATRASLTAYRAADRVSLHLADVQVAYDRATEVLSCALEYAVSNSDVELVAAARNLLRLRNERELQVIGDWQMIGRG